MTEPLPSNASNATTDNSSPEQAMLETALHSRRQQLTWLGLYISIETLAWTDPALSHSDIAAQLDLDPLLVDRALKLLKVLNPTSRSLLVANLLQSASPRVPESAAFRLTELGEESLLVEAALEQVIAKRLSELETRNLVTWVLAGYKAEAFNGATRPDLIELRTPKADQRASNVIYF